MSTTLPTAVAAELPTTQPVSCLRLSLAEFTRRVEAAKAKAQATPQAALSFEERQYVPTPGHNILWHPAFPRWFLAQLCPLPLYQVGAWLTNYLLNKPDQPLDFFDFGYVADVLRAGIGHEPPPIDACKYRRALEWVEEVGAAGLWAAQEGPSHE
jgi:hypothetical protein